jgi:hypothetical protein
MTTNSFLFAWDENGIESIIPITQYEGFEAEQTLNILSNKPTNRNPLNGILQTLILRATYNPQRCYEIYAVDCSEEMDENFWKEMWHSSPQECAELIRERGEKILSQRQVERPSRKIT